MRISQPRLIASPRSERMVRLLAEINYDSWWARPETLWFEFPAELEGQLSRNGDPWLTALLPLAVTLNEPIKLVTPISPAKRTNAERMMSIWSEWYPWLKPIQIQAAEAPSPDRQEPAKTASFFSGGLDSFFTVFHDRKTSGGSLDELIFIHGADIPIEDVENFQRVHKSIVELAAKLELPLLVAATNLRQTRFEETNYNRLSFGSLLGAIGLALGPRYRKVLISSNWSRKDIRPLGSHCDTDPLLSNDLVQFEYYVEWLNRIDKTEFLLDYPLALDNMRVCWQPGQIGNCGRCLKCLRTMAALEITGALAGAAAFEAERLDLELLRYGLLSEKRQYFEHLQRFARTKERDDVAEAIQAGFDRTRRIERALLFGIISKLRGRLYMDPTARRFLRPLYHSSQQLFQRITRWLP